jgi:hypothetical protein
MTDHHDDDLAAQKTEGFKVGEKKTLQEYQELGKWCALDTLIALTDRFPSPLLTVDGRSMVYNDTPH